MGPFGVPQAPPNRPPIRPEATQKVSKPNKMDSQKRLVADPRLKHNFLPICYDFLSIFDRFPSSKIDGFLIVLRFVHENIDFVKMLIFLTENYDFQGFKGCGITKKAMKTTVRRGSKKKTKEIKV